MNAESWGASLYARLRDGRGSSWQRLSPWHRLGVVLVRSVGEVIGSPLRFDAQAAYLAPVWEAARPGLVDGEVVVELGIMVDGHTWTVGSARVTAELGRRVRDPSPVRGRFLPGGPRPVRSRWPSA